MLLAFGVSYDSVLVMSEVSNNKLELAEAKRLKEEREQALGLVADNETIIRALTDWFSVIEKYQGRKVEEVLFDLEKFTPNGIYFTSLEYDRVAGAIIISGVSDTASNISRYLEKLERVASFGSVALLTKNELGHAGESSFKMRLLEKAHGEVP